VECSVPTIFTINSACNW